MISASAGCLACPTSCKSCVESTTDGVANTCSVCQDTFYLLNGVCTTCGITGSVSCTDVAGTLTVTTC